MIVGKLRAKFSPRRGACSVPSCEIDLMKLGEGDFEAVI